MRRRRVARTGAGAIVLAVGLAIVGAPAVLAHPLGNFTINQAIGVRVERDRIGLDVVVDAAEIPAFQLVQALDTDGDGTLVAESADGRLAAQRCGLVAAAVQLTVGGRAVATTVRAAGIAFPPGTGGLPTMRLVCELDAAVAIDDATTIGVRNGFEPERIGWHEITVVGSGVEVASSGLPAVSPSDRLTSYPTSLQAAPDVRAATVEVRPGGPLLDPFRAPEAAPVVPVAAVAGAPAVAHGEATDDGAPRAPGTTAPDSEAAAAVPGGSEALPSILRSAPTNPLIGIVALVVAALLGAGHALTPGHGKTLVAAYLVGTRGSRRHALGLGLAASVSHTAGILVLSLVVLAAERTLPVDVVVRAAPVIAAISFVAVGGWMLVEEIRRRAGGHGDEHSHGHSHEHEPAHGHDAGHSLPHDAGHSHELEPAHGHDHPERHGAGHAHGPGHAHPHRHSHSHAPEPGATVTWRGLALLGLAGGLVPSASALLVLLGAVAAGQPAWGVVLVVAFGIGMAAVMSVVGLAIIAARGRLEQVTARVAPTAVRALAGGVPVVAAVAVLAIGIVLTGQALAAARLG